MFEAHEIFIKEVWNGIISGIGRKASPSRKVKDSVIEKKIGTPEGKKSNFNKEHDAHLWPNIQTNGIR